MRIRMLVCSLFFAGLFLSPASAQVCGDVDNNGVVTIGDLTMLTGFLYTDAPIINYNAADVDGLHGVTINDAYQLSQFLNFGATLNCLPDSCYDYTISKEDTVVLPLAQCLRVPTVRLSVVTKFSPMVSGFYLPVEVAGQGSVGYTVSGANGTVPQTSGWLDISGTVAILVGTDFNTGTYSGTLTSFEIEYTLTGATPGAITTGPHDLDFGRRFVVRRGTDLFRPVVVYDMQSDYPSGDLNCDCATTLTDLTQMVNHLFVTFNPLVPCPWWPM